MKNESLNVLREKFLAFYESKGHLRLNSFPLVPQNDNSLLLINAGMAPLKPYFTGTQVPPRKRVTTCQKCIRTPDIERVGITARHGTFFEMLGNFSFGDYFKSEAIPWAWEFLTKVLEIPEELLSVSVYLDDDEARDIWLKTGVPAERIYKMGKEDNFWEIGAGPCGPCSEIYFDRGLKYGCGSPDCKPGCDCDRFIEIWNIVFTQFDGDGNGNYERLEHPNIDTGMGLERLACVMQDVNNLFEVDTIRNVMMKVCDLAGVSYEASGSDKDISLRVITDHIRSTVFLISDGVIPSNEGRGYVLRRLLRRAARHGRLLNIKGLFLSDLADTVIEESKAGYPELEEKREYIKKAILIEEERFAQTIDAGLGMLMNLIDKASVSDIKQISGDDAFKLNDTFGFPLDLTREISAEHGITVDIDGFTALMKAQKERARAARSFATDYMGGGTDLGEIIDKNVKTVFTGYGETESAAEIKYIIKDGEAVSEISGGGAILVLDQTPFYAESGGQVGDTGVISTADGVFNVTDTKKTADGQYLHFGELKEGVVALGKATATVDKIRRNFIARNHSAAHLLQAALRKVLGNHIEQAGSFVDGSRVRFDFTHFSALTPEELGKVEALVNNEILAGSPITCTEMPIEEAKAMGAMALFGEKYGDVVRVVKMGDFSTELCGGTHLDNTAKAGLFRIVSESSVAAGVRRIEGITGLNVIFQMKEEEALVNKIGATLKAANKAELLHKAESLVNETKALKKELDTLNQKAALAKVKEAADSAENVKGVKLVKARFDGVGADALRSAIDAVKDKEPLAVCVFASVDGEKVTFAAGCGKEAVAKGAHAGMILKNISPIVGGGGGGRPDNASSGGKNSAKTEEALDAIKAVLEGQIK
ncbi:MAG: alanine--tRNA ligase [Ruminococcaceae bacterium]|nr:alanine--tRNA ligase [Oscillospiraceae bacterium]